MKVFDAIGNNRNVIDSRDIIARIKYLEGDTDTLDEDERTELAALKSLAEEAEGYCPDWTYGATLIRDDYFEDYARELADDIGAVNRDSTWPNNFIDWEAAADALKQDYTEVDFDGVSYWVHS